MGRPPRVTAEANVSSDDLYLEGRFYRSPSVTLEVTFDHGDHRGALSALDRAVADVRRQITDTIPPSPQGAPS